MSIEVIINVAFAQFFLNEPVSAVRWIGALLISFGVIPDAWSSMELGPHSSRSPPGWLYV